MNVLQLEAVCLQCASLQNKERCVNTTSPYMVIFFGNPSLQHTVINQMLPGEKNAFMVELLAVTKCSN